MQRVTDVLNNIYNTGMSFQENQRKKAQEQRQGQQFALDQQLKQAQLGGAMQDQKLKQFQLDRISGGAGAQFTPGDNMRVKEYDAYGLPKSYEPADRLTAGQKLQKDKATSELFDAMETNKAKREMIADAEASLPNVPTGRWGQVQMMWMKNFDSDNPKLSDWQNIKMLGTDAQLLNTAKTKGAISDREMALFAEAAANDDVYSIPRLIPVIKKLKLFMEAEENAKLGAFKQNYGEDASAWFKNPENEKNTPSFATEEEAIKSGIKGPVLINGKKAEIS